MIRTFDVIRRWVVWKELANIYFTVSIVHPMLLQFAGRFFEK